MCFFFLGQGWRDNGTNGIVVVGSDGGAHGDVHRGCRGALANDGNDNNNDTANDDGAVGNADDILC